MKRNRVLTLFYMVLSCVLCSIAVNWVALPNGFVVTGLTGLSMTAAHFVEINYALIFYALTLVMLLCTFLALGYKEVSNIIFLSVLYPLVLWVLNHVQVEIICDHPDEIERFIIDEIHKSATIDQVIGGYSKEPKIQLDCVCNSREYVQLREFIRDRNYDCFIKVYPLTHVFGHNKDFRRLDDENL